MRGHAPHASPRPRTPTAFRRPRWAPDPDFRLEHHLHHITVGGKGTRRDVLDTAATLAETPFCQNRSPWNGYLIDGLDDGRSAYMLKISHSIADGVRLREMFLRQAAAQQPAAPPLRQPPPARPPPPNAVSPDRSVWHAVCARPPSSPPKP
ncbi:wax ester/triacylglycerol synthase domain-containing protein [Streptomyces sp. Ac-502]|uniref:wax ester/triacylglycerol synthase domain-containing protein n=1 Tax=Streptomyces sp. Ac-502 TaxID=3342801 RepID=UPI003862A7BA